MKLGGTRRNDPGHYTTILTADLDGDGQVELLGWICGFALDPKAVYRGQTEFRIPSVSITGNDISGFSRVGYGAPCDQIGPSLPRVVTPPRLPRTVKPRPPFMGFMGRAALTGPASTP